MTEAESFSRMYVTPYPRDTQKFPVTILYVVIINGRSYPNGQMNLPVPHLEKHCL